ncbi:carbamoyl-phosphate synthase small subunit [Clostridium acetobutylicum]|uniref:glutamine-hydrolyzing carbamoyl-phosphate synthase small subunit n=1 Tax=Clostridium TaxID=1485 RepID=UPI000200C40B|nr:MULTISPECIES: glutamine-hydrolyzing carbamoyl-phosphate synthase small subunit [Clostridium]ADZ21691.1 carbamoyl phosphate synthase small subunit [Clostridium acetobutylicum EA 2018]AEI34020.1 carbamoyl phosphate synthase small subunit [Clostridium acetobutylicum DSM 1731]AWV78991.1 carbamoyl-phosphate synthase (glutamine-hydrolyzing) small subunit [Clostridium acetobutylicum]MBC2395049.1 glutamine-hydrolyzing carbamoyl-phosphate synthase small subunit [Clostridium acetobutylicum]MBC2585343
MKGIIYLEDGTVFYGTGFGKEGNEFGEIVFNTSMTGYQEILTDPSYAGQIINMTYPLIGNYGVNESVNQSKCVYAKGFIVKNIDENPSNYTSEINIDQMLKNMGVVGVFGVDTRSITKKIRSYGTMKCIISNGELSIEELKKMMDASNIVDDYVNTVSTKEIIHIAGNGNKVAVMDFGIKNDIIENLKERQCDITIFPYDTDYNEILNINPDGIFLSNGPGDPKSIPEAIENVKKLIGKRPMFGICLGHQIIALASGGNTYKLKYGHRGGNHGIYDVQRDKAYITAQNHGYAVDEESVLENGMIITHRNLNDGTVEGMKHKSIPLFSVQFHPEGAPGPTDTTYLFDQFVKLMNEDKIVKVDSVKCLERAL